MESVEILDESIKEKPKDFNVAEYMNSSFSMFSGEKQSVILRFQNKLVNPVIDRFGKDAPIIPDGKEHFTVRVNVKPTDPFFAWLFQFGDMVKIIEPCEIREKYIEQIKKVLAATIND